MRCTSNAKSALIASLLAMFVAACGGLDDGDGTLRRGSGMASTSESDVTSDEKNSQSANVGAQDQDSDTPGSTTDTPADAGSMTDPGTDTGTQDPGDDVPEPATKKTLDITWKGQETYYWCGPGSTRIALSARVAASDLPSQTQIANALPTTSNGTDHIGLVVNFLNSKFGIGGTANAYKVRTIGDPASASEEALLKKNLVARIDAGYALVANVVSGWRPPTYPSGTIYHYVAIVGYDEKGDKALIADPAAEGNGGSSAWNGVPRTYWVSTHDLAVWIGGKGYTE